LKSNDTCFKQKSYENQLN